MWTLGAYKEDEVIAFLRSEFTSTLPSQIESLMNGKGNYSYNSSES